MSDDFDSYTWNESPSPPSFVRKRDGRTVPFDGDRISQDLFAATEALGRPDAFLARELSDGVIHFLTQESAEGEIPTTADITDLVIKVVRELNHPALATAFAERVRQVDSAGETANEGTLTVPCPRGSSGYAVAAECAQLFSRQVVFARDLVAAADAGLLTLGALECPDEPDSCVLGPVTPESGVLAALVEIGPRAGMLVAVEGLEYLGESAERLASDLRHGLSLARVHGVVNLNTAAPPKWADPRDAGPLFVEQHRTPDLEALRRASDELLGALLSQNRPSQDWRIDWHVGAGDTSAEGRRRLVGVVRAVLDGAPVSLVFDRERRPVALAEGLTREQTAVLLTVGLDLARLAEGVSDGETFLKRLGTLARLAASAATQKRKHLRHHGGMSRGFLPDRARLMVVPTDLDLVCERFAADDPSGFGRAVVMRLCDVLRQETCIHVPVTGYMEQLKIGDVLHRTAGDGTWTVAVPSESTPEELADWLCDVWRQTAIVRVRLS
jgi:ATP cone domain